MNPVRGLGRFPGIALLCAIPAACLLAPFLTGAGRPGMPGGLLPHPAAIDLDSILSPPSARHWLGTDLVGRDLLSRLLNGGRTSLTIAAGAALLALLIGATLGLGAGLAGGWIDLLVGRMIEVVDCLPTLLVALAAAGAGWGSGPVPLTLAIALTRWGHLARLARVEALRWRATPRRDSALAVGAGTCRLLAHHAFPAALPILATACALVAAEALVVEAGIGAIGFGVEPPAPTWGGLLLEARLSIDQAWWPVVFPGVAIFVAVSAALALAEPGGSGGVQTARPAGAAPPPWGSL